MVYKCVTSELGVGKAVSFHKLYSLTFQPFLESEKADCRKEDCRKHDTAWEILGQVF